MTGETASALQRLGQNNAITYRLRAARFGLPLIHLFICSFKYACVLLSSPDRVWMI